MITEVRKRTRKTVFKKGVKPYIGMLLVIFIFSFLDVFYSMGTKEVDSKEEMLDMETVEKKDVDAVEEYIVSMSVFDKVPEFVKTNVVKRLARRVATSHPSVLNSLSSNQEFFENHMGEVLFFLIAGMVVLGVIKFFLTRPFLVGQCRYLMEARFQRNVRIRRIFAPFGDKKFLRVYTTMSRYNLFSILWWLTIVGGFYKYYQYYFVKYILAENPNVKWKQARDLSKAMTDGYKFTIFKTNLSYIYLTLLRYIPFVPLFITTPVRENVSVEMYFWLRKRPDIDRSLFIEKAFDEEAYIDRIEAGENPEDIKPVYLMTDFSISGSSFDENDHYSLRDYIVLFFIFSIFGWIWEFSTSMIDGHAYVSSNNLYGPWIEVYGIFGIIFVAVLCRFKNNNQKFAVATVLLGFIMECLYSFLLVFHNMKMSSKDMSVISAVINRFSFSELFLFIVVGFLCAYIIAPHVKNALDRLGEKKTKVLCRALILLYVIDVIVSAIVYYHK